MSRSWNCLAPRTHFTTYDAVISGKSYGQLLPLPTQPGNAQGKPALTETGNVKSEYAQLKYYHFRLTLCHVHLNVKEKKASMLNRISTATKQNLRK